MSYTENAGLEIIPSGQADWDASFNANMNIIDRGIHAAQTAGSLINSGDVVCVNSGAYVNRMDANSAENIPSGISFTRVDSGANGYFILAGVLRGMGWNFPRGKPLFVSANTPGLLVTSYAGHGISVGISLGTDGVFFRPNHVILPATQEAALADLDALVSEISSATYGVSDLYSRVNSLGAGGSSGVESLTTRINSAEIWVGSLQTRINSNEISIGSLQTRIASSETRIASNETRINSLATSIGSNAVQISSLQVWEAGLTIGTTPSSGEVLLRYAFPRAVRFNYGLAGWKAVVGTAASSGYNLSVKKNSGAVGNVYLPPATTGLTGSFTTTGSFADFAAGDILTIEAPTMTDLTLSSFGITLFGDRR